uniref:Uncharacterized protein n=1 Tax=Leptospira adleri TaxID=2023186 RepID=A0A2M9YS40_9LEPT|nr:hypothetical protein CH380_04385 [Leptospira adleri]PJZ60529.1 hypothetical protein CH376_17860 [Leptospira adleri]
MKLYSKSRKGWVSFDLGTGYSHSRFRPGRNPTNDLLPTLFKNSICLLSHSIEVKILLHLNQLFRQSDSIKFELNSVLKSLLNIRRQNF